MSKLPKTQLGRLEFVGRELYGNRWKLDTARGVGVSREALIKWLSGKNDPPSDLDARLIALLDSVHLCALETDKRRMALLDALKRIVD